MIVRSLLLLMLTTGSVAAEPANKWGLCWMVDFYVGKYGEDAAYQFAKTHDWAEHKINAACRCLNFRPAACQARRAEVPVAR